MTKIIVTNEEELEALLKRVLNEALQPLLLKLDSHANKPTSEIMNIKQVSELLNISVATIYGKTSARTIPHFKKGKRLYFKRDELLEWITLDKRKTTDELLREWEEKQRNRKRR